MEKTKVEDSRSEPAHSVAGPPLHSDPSSPGSNQPPTRVQDEPARPVLTPGKVAPVVKPLMAEDKVKLKQPLEKEYAHLHEELAAAEQAVIKKREEIDACNRKMNLIDQGISP